MTSWQNKENDELISHDHKRESWWNDKLIKWQGAKMISWQNDSLAKWQFDEMTCWQNNMLTK